MTVRAAQVDTLDLLSYPYDVHGEPFAPDLPEARLSDFGRNAQKAGARKLAAHYDDAPWQITVTVAAPTESETDFIAERVAELDYAFRPGVMLVWDEGAGSAWTEIVTAEIVGTPEKFDTFWRLTYTGTRKPWWASRTWQFSGVADDSGMLLMPDVAGELAAEMSLQAISPSAWTCLPVGLKVDAAPGYAPKTAYAPATLTMNSSLANVTAGSSLDVATHRGSHLAVAYIAHSAASAATVRYRVGSTISASTDYEPPVTPASATNTAAYVPLGTVRIPTRDLPGNTAATTLGMPATDWSQTAYNYVWASGVSAEYVFTVRGDQLTSITLNFGAAWNPGAAGEYGALTLYRGIGRKGGASSRLGGKSYSNPAIWSWKGSVAPGTKTFTVNVPVTDGESLTLYLHTNTNNVTIPVRFQGGASVNSGYFIEYDSDGNPVVASTVDLYLVTKTQRKVPFSAAIPVQASCTESSKVATLTALHLIPTDYGSLTVAGSGVADTGWSYDPASRAVYPCDSSGVTGVALAGTATPTGSLEPVPGRTNHLVTLPHVYLAATVTERNLHCIGAVGAMTTAAIVEPPPPPQPDPPVVYVASTGSNSADGSLATPWQTLAYAAAHVSAGDTVVIRGGTYNERLKLTVDGTSGAHITWQPYPGETVQIAQGIYFNADYNDVSDITVSGGLSSLPAGEDPAGIGGADGHANFVFNGDYCTLTRAKLVGRGTAFYVPSVNFYGAHNTVTDPDFSYCGGIKVLGDGRNLAGKGRYNTVTGGTIHHTAYQFADIMAHDFTLDGCNLHDANEVGSGDCDGINLDGTGITIRNNRIYRVYKRNTDAHSDAIQWWNNADNLVIEGNVIGSFWNPGVYADTSMTALNGFPYIGDEGHITFANGAASDGLHTYTGAAVSANNVKIRNNVFLCAGEWYFLLPGTWSGDVLAIKSGKCTGWEVVNNTFYGKQGLLYRGSSYFTNWKVCNNYIGSVAAFTTSSDPNEQFVLGAGSVMDYNVYAAASPYDADATTHSGTTTTPGFVSADMSAATSYGVNSDLRLAASSPLLNAGSATYAPTTDKDGNSRVGNPDIGAYERQ